MNNEENTPKPKVEKISRSEIRKEVKKQEEENFDEKYNSFINKFLSLTPEEKEQFFDTDK